MGEVYNNFVMAQIRRMETELSMLFATTKTHLFQNSLGIFYIPSPHKLGEETSGQSTKLLASYFLFSWSILFVCVCFSQCFLQFNSYS